MMHLLRSLFVGYFIAVAVGTIAVMNGYTPLSVVLGVWLAGSVLSVVIAAAMTPFAGDADHEMPINAIPAVVDHDTGPMHADRKARELARWDADLAAELFEVDLARDAKQAADATATVHKDRKAG